MVLARLDEELNEVLLPGFDKHVHTLKSSKLWRSEVK